MRAVRDVDGGAGQGYGTGAAVLAVDLEVAKIDTFFDGLGVVQLCGRAVGELADPFAGAVVDVVGGLRDVRSGDTLL